MFSKLPNGNYLYYFKGEIKRSVLLYSFVQRKFIRLLRPDFYSFKASKPSFRSIKVIQRKYFHSNSHHPDRYLTPSEWFGAV